MKDKRITIRLSESENTALEKLASSKKIAPSTFARSLLVTAIENNLEITPISSSAQSPSPALDKLSFSVRHKLLRMFDCLAGICLVSGMSVIETEKVMLANFDVTDKKVFDDLMKEKALLEKQ